jgi:hypothetical protein
MTTIDAQTLIRKAANGAQILAFLEVIAAAAAAGTLEAPEEAPEADYSDDEADDEADYSDGEHDLAF